MASNQTSNYGLNQWEATDQVLREEFNADNQKIDEALAQKLGRRQDIKTVLTANHSRIIQLDLSDIDWNEWEVVGITFPQSAGGGSDSQAVFTFDINSGQYSGHNSMGQSVFLTVGPLRPFVLTLYPCHDETRKVLGSIIGPENGICIGNCTFSQLTSFRVTMPSINFLLPDDLPFVIWGIQ